MITNFIPDLVSIITPAYNAGSVLGEAVASVRAQTYASWEMIITDDNSKDNTLAIARELAGQDRRIRVIAREENGGPAATKNEAIRVARGQYLAYLDSDDVWLPHKLETQLKFLKLNNVGMCFSSYQPFTASGRSIHPVLAPAKVDYRKLLKENVIGCLTVMIDRYAYPAIPTPTLDYEDFASWLTLLRDGGEARGIREVLALYRISSNSVSSKKTRSAGWVWRIYREHEKLNLPESIWYFANFSFGLLRRRLVFSERRTPVPVNGIAASGAPRLGGSSE